MQIRNPLSSLYKPLSEDTFKTHVSQFAFESLETSSILITEGTLCAQYSQLKGFSSV